MNKREQDVLDQVRQRTADIKVPEKLEPDNIRRMLVEKEREKEKKEKYTQMMDQVKKQLAHLAGQEA